MDFLRSIQLDLMSTLGGACLITAFFASITKSLPLRRKGILIFIELSAAFLLFFDRFTYIYNGASGRTGYVMIRLSNFMLYSLTLLLVLGFNMYLSDMYLHEGELKNVPRVLKTAEISLKLGLILTVIAHFTGLYYTFDTTNTYHRSTFFWLCYIVPVAAQILQLYAIIRFRRRISRRLYISLLLFAVVPLIACIPQMFIEGISFINLSVVGVCIAIYIFTHLDMVEKAEAANAMANEFFEKEQEDMERLLKRLSGALVSAIDAKDEFTRGHSVRVADYARKIAEIYGKSEKECNEAYFAGLLHDVGKTGIRDALLSKGEGLTEEEFEAIKRHPVIGGQILSSIDDRPYLSIGATYHHENFDGTGYPEGLKGEEIPEIARILAVANAYEVMSAKKSYREPMPQEQIREELLKGSGTKYDPQFVNAMLHIIDMDSNYNLKEDSEVRQISENSELYFDEYRSMVSEGIHITSKMTSISFRYAQNEDFTDYACVPALILFDSLDRTVHDEAKTIEEYNYLEYGEIWLDGHIITTAARNMVVNIIEDRSGSIDPSGNEKKRHKYRVQAVRNKDHVLIRVKNPVQTLEVIAALPDSSRYVYLGLTGEHSRISRVKIDVAANDIKEDFIPRIAEELSFINRLEGDLPNIQIDGYRSASTGAIPIRDGTKIEFHTMSLPSARTVWHCPLISIFYSTDGKEYGKDYREYALISLDGERREGADEERAENELITEQKENFKGWEYWKKKNKKGLECEVSFRIRGNNVIMTTENLGVSVRNTTTVSDKIGNIYFALTGDQIAITDIRIKK
ncbi:MAG: HD-GYP domain-containing protein [Lachnospiraceae bacterium]|nr:HD-GYP domain-containing protein [Lachnospiraceae bacterium]